jgi:tetratricopeptide (TPR) repeat protein
MSLGKISCMNPFRVVLLILAVVVFYGAGDRALAQDDQDNQPNIQPRKEEKQKHPVKPAPTPQPAPTEDQPQTVEPEPGNEVYPDGLQPGESSSKDSQIDLNAGPPRSSIASTRTNDEPLPYDPHRAMKDLEVGNYYLKQKNYRAALERFHDALLYKPDDAEATYGLAVTQEKMDLFAQAYNSYSKYLDILPNGPMAKESEEGMKRVEQHLPAETIKSSEAKMVAQDLAQGEKHLANNEYQAARQSFEHAMRLNPDNAVISFRLAQSLQGVGQPDAARMYYQKYLELQPNGPLAADAKKKIAEINDMIGK